ncbi:hypothetical protein [Paenibacillus graminis]|uniref:Uncharacterized protein n=1 Tax=Paenibacillus graminis TaxID=189425 RepID=A0A089NR96_9BACL|nr:hypothetical protein [Paenibacillus graminis]AIQ71624.1 hypothetical protein PGRAT_31595 [Paenibacillus graminis]
MEEVHSAEKIMEILLSMDTGNSTRDIRIPGKGEFKIILQKEDDSSNTAVIHGGETARGARTLPASELPRNPYL